MDKNTVIGFVLIFLVLIGFQFITKPTEAQLEAARIQDSIAYAEQQKVQEAILVQEALQAQRQAEAAGVDSEILNEQLVRQYGLFASCATGQDSLYTIGNNLMTLTLSSKGGRIASVQLNDYVTWDSLPLILFDEETSSFGLTLTSADRRVVNTQDLYFVPVPGDDSLQFVFRLPVSEQSHLDFVYTLQPDNYLMDFDIRGEGLEDVLSMGTNSLDVDWAVKMRAQERGRKFASRYTMLQYKYLEDDVEKLSESKDSHKKIAPRLRWVSFKDQFFCAVFLSDKGFTSNELSSAAEKGDSPYIKSYSMRSAVDFNMRGSRDAHFNFYFGPSKYDILKAYDKGVDKADRLQLDRIVPLGGNIIRWVSTWLVLPMFRLFGRFCGNMGLIILLMTICIKVIIFPLSYNSFMSSAKMRLLKPQMDEINARYPGDSKAQERSQATMDLYKKAGVNPMGGCVPMLLQMPVLIAMFWFFPASIELRQQSFLWAQDLSTYDALISWHRHIPFISGLFGDHISLFCVLMTITQIFSTKISSTGSTSDNQMPGMKFMMYLMPIMFFFMFNNYAAGLSYYYFISSLLTIGQTFLCRAFVNEEKMQAKLKAAASKKPEKSKFQKRLEEAQRMQREQAKANAKKNYR